MRRTGKSYAHPLVLLIASQSKGEQCRYGVTARRTFGGAVKRNRAKRRMRTALQGFTLNPGWDLILVARPGLDEVAWDELTKAIGDLLKKAGVIGQLG